MGLERISHRLQGLEDIAVIVEDPLVFLTFVPCDLLEVPDAGGVDLRLVDARLQRLGGDLPDLRLPESVGDIDL